MADRSEAAERRLQPVPMGGLMSDPEVSYSTIARVFGDRRTPERDAPRRQPVDDARLAAVIEGEIIPRLLLLQTGRDRFAPTAAGSLEAKDFARRALVEDAAGLSADVAAEVRGGRSLESICLDVLAPAARWLGEMWRDDTASFAEVTLALGRLQCVVHEIGRTKRARAMPGARRLLLMPAPGEAHTFGIAVLSEMFQARGWRVDALTDGSALDAARAADAARYDLIGFSIGGSDRVNDLRAAVAAVRGSRRNAATPVLVGGALLEERPDLLADCGADGLARDGDEALAAADALVRPASYLYGN